MRAIPPSMFKLMRNIGLVISIGWLVIWAYLYFSHSSLLWRKGQVRKTPAPAVTTKRASGGVGERTKPAEEAKPKKIPVYEGYLTETWEGFNLEMVWVKEELDQLSGKIEQIEGNVVVLRVNTLSLRHTPLQDDAAGEKLVKVIIDNPDVEVFRDVGLANASSRGNLSDLRVGQRITFKWARPQGSNERFLLWGIGIEVQAGN